MEEIVEVNWNSFDATMCVEESELMSQLLGTYTFPIEQDVHDLNFEIPPMYWPDHAADNATCYDNVSVSSSCFFVQPPECQTYYTSESNFVSTTAAEPEGTGICMELEAMVAPSNSFVENIVSDDPKPQLKRKFITEVDQKVKNPKTKKPRKSIRNADREENNVVVPNVHSASSCDSEDDSVAFQEAKALNLNGKARASRGSATDPQSLYARKRRERINERLRILQNLVPNGTKVDISTMLEEAVQYVKFLQLQIKLLSSDDLWMYAPLAYNGMDIGLDLKLALPKQ